MMNPVAAERPSSAEVRDRIARILKRIRVMNWQTINMNPDEDTVDETIRT
jgi:hypothetical protein